ncbi:MAG: hypothetical protein IT215_00590 [Chitinophagaceae bacterium]|nr:MAG: hypothetical protein UZ11_BCD004001821 [Bacteroidetes bacterium OLB11]MCC6447168.1 hypothetical protein [Chitinophagaceae bacterium]HMN33667.1 hypothetical protein [Chitinophagaceae bacterium]
MRIKATVLGILGLSSLLSSCMIFHSNVQTHEPYYTPSPKVKKVEKAIETPTIFEQNYKFKTDQNYIRSVTRIYYGQKTQMQTELGKYNIRKSFNVEQYRKFNKASFFPSNEYTIPNEIKPKAIALYKPLLDSMFAISNQTGKSHLEILVLGYTDEESIPYSNPIYNELLTKNKKESFVDLEYYNALSYERAKIVADLLSEMIKNELQKTKSPRSISFDLLIEGRGIEYPESKRIYELEDDKRKITKVYWKLN